MTAAMWFAYHQSLGLAAELGRDRQNQLLPLVFLTGARSHELFLSRLVSRALNASLSALALLPCLMISILYGGVTLQLCIAAFLFFLAAVIFFIAFEFLGAAVKKEPGAAEQFATRAKLVALAWPWVLDECIAIISKFPMPKWIYLLTPAHVGWTIWEGLRFPWQYSEALLGILIAAVSSLALLALSAWVLDRSWQRDAVWTGPHQWLTRAQRRWATQIRPLLETSPLLWLAAFDRTALLYAWTSTLAILAAWLIGFAIWQRAWLLPVVTYATILLIIAVVRTQILLRATRRVARARADGELELLLTTPENPDLLIDAEFDAVLLQFRSLRRFIRGAAVVLLVITTAAFAKRPPSALWTHAIVSAFLLWTAELKPTGSMAFYLWIALNTGQGSGQVFKRLGGSAVGGLWPLYNVLRHGLGQARTLPTGNPVEITIAFVGALVVAAIATAINYERQQYRTRLYRHLRAIAQAPLPPSSSIKFWDGQQPLVP